MKGLKKLQKQNAKIEAELNAIRETFKEIEASLGGIQEAAAASEEEIMEAAKKEMLKHGVNINNQPGKVDNEQ